MSTNKDSSFVRDFTNNMSRAFWLKFKLTFAYRTFEKMSAYKLCYENLFQSGLPIARGADSKSKVGKTQFV